MFDKATYRKRRDESQRGQETVQPRFYAKGDKVPYTNRKGEAASYPNDLGAEMVRTKAGFTYVNRTDRRKKLPTVGSKPNYEYQGSKKTGFVHVVNDPWSPDLDRPAKTGHTMNRRLHLHARWLRKLAAQNKLMEV